MSALGSTKSAVLALSLAFASGCSSEQANPSQAAPQQPGTAGNGSGGVGTMTGGSANGGGDAPVTGGPGRVVMHRLNIAEYDNTVHDLLGTAQRLSENFPPDDTAFGFDNVAAALSLSDVALGYYIDTTRNLVKEALTAPQRARFVSCDVATQHETCVTESLSAFLPKAWRRPVEADEVARLVALYTSNKADGASDDEALARAFQAALLAPEFLFRVERNSGTAGVRALNGYELASRLSYFLWSSMPDQELTGAAESGALVSDAGLTAQITRLLADTRAAAFSSSFGSQWLSLRTLDNVHPDAKTYASFDEPLRAAMRAESMLMFTDVATGKRPFGELFTQTSGYVNDRLAQHYGMAAVGSMTPQFVPLPPERVGLLAQASILTVQAHPTESAPVLRGKWILNQLLCRALPPPPPDVPQEPAAAAGQSRRERLQAHRVQAICKSCHDMMDPLGLALENFDGVGHYRTEDNGVPIDPSGTLVDGTAFKTPQELAGIIAKDPALLRCLSRQVFTYGLGRGPRAEAYDEATLDKVTQTFNDGGQLFPKLVEAVVMSEAFRKREDEAAVP